MMGLLTGKASEMVVEEGKEVVSSRAMPCLELRRKWELCGSLIFAGTVKAWGQVQVWGEEEMGRRAVVLAVQRRGGG